MATRIAAPPLGLSLRRCPAAEPQAPSKSACAAAEPRTPSKAACQKGAHAEDLTCADRGAAEAERPRPQLPPWTKSGASKSRTLSNAGQSLLDAASKPAMGAPKGPLSSPKARSSQHSSWSSASTEASPTSTHSSRPPRASLASLCSGMGEENIPWLEYEDAVLAPGVVREEMTLPSDGPPGFIRATLTSGCKPGSKGHRGAVVCGAGCYECVEGPSCLFNKLASKLPQNGIDVLQLAYRPPGDEEEEATEDIMTCIDWLVETGRKPIVLLGWSMGAAAVIEAAYLRRNLGVVKAICTLAGQTAGTRNLAHMEVPFLAIHGEDDSVLPASTSKTLVQRARNGSLKLLPNSTHRVEEALPHVVDFVNAHVS